MTNQPEVENARTATGLAKPAGLFELIALLIICSALFFSFHLFFHWLARTYDVQILEIGRRVKFADVLSGCGALLLTNIIAKLLGIAPSKGKPK